MIKQLQRASAFARRKVLVEIRKLEAVIKGDPYDKLAAELQDVLLHGWNAATKEAIDNVIRALANRSDQLELFAENDLQEMLANLRVLLGDKFAGDIAADLDSIILETYATGLAGSAAIKPSFNVVDTKAIKWLQQHNVYWVKHHFEDHLQEKVVEFGEQIIKGGLNRAEAGKLFEDEFAQKYNTLSWRYWQGFANHVVTRSREFGNVERYVRAGVEYLQVKAVNDHRTTEICRHMHNRVIKVSKAVEMRDAMMAAQTPEEVIAIAPWMKPDAMVTKPSKSLPVGMSLPPYHFNCRSRTVKASASVVEAQTRYEKRVQLLHKNADYKSQYNDYRELGKDAPVHRSLRFDENVAVWAYTRDMYYDLNTSLYSGKKLTKFQQSYAEVLNSGLSKIKRSKGTFFRGARLPAADLTTISKAKTIKWNGFGSTSGTTPFSGRNTIFVVDGLGHGIRDLSFYKNEDEYLFRPGATFKVLKSEKVNEKWYIHLKQTAQEEMFEKATSRSFDEAIQFHEEQLQKLEELEGEERDNMQARMQHLDAHVNPGGVSEIPEIIE